MATDSAENLRATTIILITSTSMLAGAAIAGAIGVPLHYMPARPWSYDVAALAGMNLVLWLAVGIWRKRHAKAP
jgi:hypothetical protein